MAGLFKANTGSSSDDKKSGGLFKASTSSSSPDPSKSIMFQGNSGSSGSKGLFKAGTATQDILNKPFDTTSLDKSISNAKLRVQSAGFPVEEDKRNWFEKATNLPEGQNWFFDTLDIINRPQQALFGGMEAILDTANGTPTDRDKAFMDGLTGKNKTRGADLLEKLGVTNKPTKAITGFVADVATDPLNLIPAAAINKVVGSVGKGAQKSGQALESAVPALKTFRETKIQPSLTAGKDALGNIFVPKYKWDQTLQGGKDDFLKNRFVETENAIRYMGDESLRGITDAARKAGGLDTGTDVGRIMEKDLKQFEDVQMYEFPDGLRRTTSKRELGNEIIGNKQRIKELGQGVREANRTLDSSISNAAKGLDKIDNDLRRMFMSAENKKLKALQKTDPSSLNQPKLIRGGFTPNSPALNLLARRVDEAKTQLDNAKTELGLPKVRKQSYTPEKMQDLATSRAFKQLSPSPAFNVLLKQRDELKTELDQLRDIRKTSGEQDISAIQRLVDENKAIKESAKNPVMVQREIARPQRDLSTDTAVVKAADTLVKSNDAIRQWAVNNDIPVGEIEGYMRHILSAEEAALKKTKKGGPLDRSPSGMNNPDKSVLKSRELTGSVEDINERIGRKFFEPNAFFASALGQKKLIEYGNAVKFRKDVLDNPSFAKKAKPGEVTPEGAVKIDTNNYKFLNDPNNPSLSADIGGEYIVTKGVKQALDRYSKLTSDDGINAFLKVYDSSQGLWKKLTLLSPEYHLRNDIGAKFNNYVGGMNPVEIAKYSASSTTDVLNALARGKESPLYNEFRRQGLGSNSQLAQEFAKHGNDAEKAFRSIVKDQSRSTTAKAFGVINPLRLFKTSQELGTAVDQINRMALYKWARQSKGMTPEQAAAKVKEVQFDYSDLTPVEREFFVRAIPFYRWSRNNLPFQINKLVTSPTKYANIGKLKDSSQQYFGMDPNNEQDYTKNNLAFPITGDGKGNGYMLGLNLPASDLTKLSDPFKLLTDSLTPVAKTPMELSVNRNFFNGKEIEQFEGQQKKFQTPNSLFGMNMPGGGRSIGGLPVKLNHALEQLGGQPARRLSKLLEVQTEQDKENAATNPVFGISNIFKKYNIDETNFYDKKAELRRLMDLIQYIEQETGTKPKTINQIKKGL